MIHIGHEIPKDMIWFKFQNAASRGRQRTFSILTNLILVVA